MRRNCLYPPHPTHPTRHTLAPRPHPRPHQLPRPSPPPMQPPRSRTSRQRQTATQTHRLHPAHRLVMKTVF
jgi:hypothetical protein